jgi:AcrR family transcriptional regulator
MPAPLEAVLPIFRQQGPRALSDEAIANALNISVADLTAQYGDRPTLVYHAILADIERQKRNHQEIYDQYPTAVERLYALLQYGLRDMEGMSPLYVMDLQREEFSRAWDTAMEHMATYSAQQMQQLLNDGIRQRLFRSDINIQLVTKIILEQVTLLINPQIFPPDRYNMAEVFRSIFLYYIRGLCTDEGARIAANHFSRL